MINKTITPINLILIFITPVLRYNSYAIKFTLLRYTAQWFLAYSLSCASVTVINIETFSSFPCYPQNSQPRAITNTLCLIDLPSLDISHSSRIYNMWFFVSAFFHLKMFSRFIHVISCVRT